MNTADNYWSNRVATEREAESLGRDDYRKMLRRQDRIDSFWWAVTIIFVCSCFLAVVAFKTVIDGPPMYLTHALIAIMGILASFGVWKMNR